MKNNLELLMAIKKVIDLDETGRYSIHTINRDTKWEGCASFHTNGENKIKVFEGSRSGDDDHSETYEDFVKKYRFTLVVD